ncbi:MAG: T9SS type A sorting domain-containing protein [Chryseobacterium sp.]|nr:MAG: T9SS type A sorting domain-containing protein [Chryseobacterium sp.]
MKKMLLFSLSFIFLINLCYSQTFQKKLIAYSNYEYVQNTWEFTDSFRVFCKEDAAINNILYRDGFMASFFYGNLVWKDMIDMKINAHDLLFRSTTYLYEFDAVDSLVYYKDSTNAPSAFFRNSGTPKLDSTKITGHYDELGVGANTKLKYQYINQNLVEVTTQVWDASLGIYDDFWVDSFEYNSAGQITRHSVLMKNAVSGIMEGFFQSIFHYTPFQKLQEYQHLVYDNTNNTWNQQRKYVIDYGANNLPVEAKEFSVDVNQPVAKYNWVYNTNDLLLSETKHVWQNGNWLNNNRIFDFVYNANGFPISKSRYESGEPVNKDEFIYNSMDSLVAIDHKSYIGNNVFNSTLKTQIERDIDNDVTSIVSLQWNAVTNTHEGYSWRYNAYYNGLREVSLTPRKQLAANITLYPNPGNNFLIINYPGSQSYSNCTARIYDISGRLVKTERGIKLNQRFSIAELNPGSYIVEIELNEQKVTKQFPRTYCPHPRLLSQTWERRVFIIQKVP